MADRVDPEEVIVGKRIVAVERTDDYTDPAAPAIEDGRYLRLRFDDGSVAIASGIGYDGLWDDVGLDYFGPVKTAVAETAARHAGSIKCPQCGGAATTFSQQLTEEQTAQAGVIEAAESDTRLRCPNGHVWALPEGFYLTRDEDAPSETR